jgi:hypothetical protein
LRNHRRVFVFPVSATVAVSVYSRALQKAAELVGGREKLAKILRVPRDEIDGWIADKSKPPREIFLRVVDLILDESPPAGDASEAQEPSPPRDCATGSSRHYPD